jgi:hypothetical protein
MSEILLIEPDRMLRHALILALFPEHRVKTAPAVPDAVKEFDLLIVDAAALQKQNLLSARERERLQAWKLPVLWFGADAALPESTRDRWVRLQLPLTKDVLRRALAQCLEASVKMIAVATPAAQLPANAEASATPKARNKKSAETGAGKSFIELVDVVEEEPA